MAKVMKTMDGNTAVAWSSYAFTEVAVSSLLHHLHLWLKSQMNGPLTEERTFSDSL